jgi:protein-tyrosine phosphatase
MNALEGLADIHCHLLPGLDDGPAGWDEAAAMAEMLVAEGLSTVVATPHQLGIFSATGGDTIREQTGRLQGLLAEREIPLRVLPGAEIRVEARLAARIQSGRLLSLADHRRHVLLEMPAEVFLPLDRVLAELAAAGMVPVLAHPERNRGAWVQPERLEALVDQGCLLQVTAGSLTGLLGEQVRGFSELLIRRGLVHFVATDAHFPGPLCASSRAALRRVADLAGEDRAEELFHTNPARVAAGQPVAQGQQSVPDSGWPRWLCRRRAG